MKILQENNLRYKDLKPGIKYRVKAYKDFEVVSSQTTAGGDMYIVISEVGNSKNKQHLNVDQRDVLEIAGEAI